MVHRQDYPLEHMTTLPRHVDSLSSSNYKKAPVRFRIEPAPQYCNEQGHLICSPGALFEGVVLVQLNEPLAAVRLRLVFKLSEMLNYDAMKWGQRIIEDRIYNIRTVLWGHPSSHDNSETTRSWPIMEPGYHLFPFTCAMPNVNYPPSTLNNSLVQYPFHMIATLDRPGFRPFQTEPCVITFQPKIPVIPPSLSITDNNGKTSYHEERQLGTISVTVHVPTTLYHTGDILTVSIRATDSIVVSVSLEQHFKVTTSAFHHSKTIVVKHVDQRRMETGEIDIPLDEQDVSPSFEYGRKVEMRYFIKVVAKSKQNTLQTKKKTFLIPIFIGTLASDAMDQEDLILPYTDDVVVNDTTLRTKPKFLRHQSEPLPILPPYDPVDCPPDYCSEHGHHHDEE
ncbi:hypothetical protein BDA99DRAFT_565225 [Phascolomyces articulosus]|uniref:Arrestin C-terminal-like domain-containing protein n=1 Tax=Phascolomyces articulosus TaxID=60185 RepID=A0AAD5JPA2_9FUNG|nr:hypothetical protein BDA99DRAFT_565225 [Phascolomyces articulosus]